MPHVVVFLTLSCCMSSTTLSTESQSCIKYYTYYTKLAFVMMQININLWTSTENDFLCHVSFFHHLRIARIKEKRRKPDLERGAFIHVRWVGGLELFLSESVFCGSMQLKEFSEPLLLFYFFSRPSSGGHHCDLNQCLTFPSSLVSLSVISAFHLIKA